LQAPGSIDHDVDDNDSVTIDAFAEAFLNDDSQSVSSQFDSPSRPILDNSPPLSVSSPTHPYCPTTVAIVRSIQKHISVRSLPPGATPTVLERPIRGSTLAGTIECFAVVYLRDVSLPELNSSRRADSLRAFVFKKPCNYDLILGNDFCATSGLVLDFAAQQIHWFEDSLPFKPPPSSRAEAAFNAMQALLLDANAHVYAANIIES
jgi:hypothetical protein